MRQPDAHADELGADLAHLGANFSFVPWGLLQQATHFGLGEALVAGKISPHPTAVRFGARVTEEGGGDVTAGWAKPAQEIEQPPAD